MFLAIPEKKDPVSTVICHPTTLCLIPLSYLFSTIPLYLWYLVVRDVSLFREALIQVYRNGLLVPTIVIIVGLVVGTELLVAAFFFRLVNDY